MKGERNWKPFYESMSRRADSSVQAVEPVGEERLFAGLVHAGDGEMEFLPGGEANSIFIDRADLGDSDLHAGVDVAEAVELETGTAEDELTGTAASEGFFVAGVIG